METFNEEDIRLFELAKTDNYKITIDNDSVYVDSIEEDSDEYYNFSMFGTDFIHALLIHLGIKADYC